MFLNGGFSELKVFLEGWNREHPSQRVHQGIHLQNTWYMLWMQLLALNAANSNYPFKQECFIWERERERKHALCESGLARGGGRHVIMPGQHFQVENGHATAILTLNGRRQAIFKLQSLSLKWPTTCSLQVTFQAGHLGSKRHWHRWPRPGVVPNTSRHTPIHMS